MPVFRQYNVALLLTGHEHLSEHCVERYRDATGTQRRIEQVVSSGGGAPLYAYQGELDTRAYIRDAGADSVRFTHLVKPSTEPSHNAFHYVVAHVDGPRMCMEVIGVDWGRGYQPYRSNRASLADSAGR